MAIETEAVLDRRNLRRRIGLWRGLAILGAVAFIAALASRFGPANLAEQRQIARVSVDAMITEDRDVLRMLKRIAENKNVQGVILAINSGGGTTTGGEAWFEAVRELREKKPVVAQFGTVAASAAYIVGLSADHIVARGNTITGSVGVIFQSPDVSGLLDKVGVKVNEIKSGPLKAVPSLFGPLSPDGRQVAEGMIADSQKWFLSLVASRRNLKTADVPGLEQGSVFTGRAALAHKLIDEIGGEAEAIRWLESRPNVAKNLRVVDWRPRRSTDLGLFRLMLALLTGWIGREGDVIQLSDLETGVRAGLLDGLVSVWQPASQRSDK
jgi:protease-4